LASAIVLLVVSCESSTEPPKALSASITPADTTIFVGDTVTLEVVVEYESGPAAPDTVVWTITDSVVLSRPVVEDGRATVAGRERGVGYVIAEINNEFVDSAEVTVVRPGDVRWQVEINNGTSTTGPALDSQGRVYVTHWGPEQLTAFEPSGAMLYSVAGCLGNMSPSVSSDNHAYASGGACIRRYGPSGAVDWALSVGTFDGGIALASDGSAVAITGVDSDPVVLVHISPDGASSSGATRWVLRPDSRNRQRHQP
jgi:outer membrane protein assembly factor BamB